jgi:hypothetical protein
VNTLRSSQTVSLPGSERVRTHCCIIRSNLCCRRNTAVSRDLSVVFQCVEVLQDFVAPSVLLMLTSTVCTFPLLSFLTDRHKSRCFWMVTVMTSLSWLTPRVLRCTRTEGFSAPTLPELNAERHKLWNRRDREPYAMHPGHPTINSLGSQPSLWDGSRAAHVKITIIGIPSCRNYCVVLQHTHYLQM